MKLFTEGVVQVLNLTPRVLFAVWSFGVILHFLPDSTAETLNVVEFRKVHSYWLGPTTLAAFVLWASYALAIIPRWIAARFYARSYRARVLNTLDTLGREELRVLAYFVHSMAPTQYLWFHLPPAIALRSKGLLIECTGSGNIRSWPHTVPTFVWKEIIARRNELFPELNGPDAATFFGDFDEWQREITLYRR